MIESNNIKICNVCKVVLDDINWSSSSKKGKSNICKKCSIQKTKDWNKNNPYKFIKQRKIYADKKTLLSKDGKRHGGLNKRPKPKTCELCDKKKRLHYHHWDDTNLNKGIWVCATCHWGTEFIDKNKSNILTKYIEFKNNIEVVEYSRCLFDDLQRFAIYLNKKMISDKKKYRRLLEYNKQYLKMLRFSMLICTNIQLREDIKYNLNTGNIQYITYFEASGKKELLEIQI